MAEPGGHLLVIGDREPLAWVLAEQRMAFPPTRTREAGRLALGDLLLIYTTRGCFRNPTRDMGRVIGEAVVASAVRQLDEPVRFRGRSYPVGCDIEVRALAPYPTGVTLAHLVPDLEAFPNRATWSTRMRRALVPLSATDVRLIRKELAPLLSKREAAISGYEDAVPAATQRASGTSVRPPRTYGPGTSARRP